ncbi:MAG TPA: Crp/Fnr family transcriptional regulator [Candidatus Saccharimonadales bacterium]|nr:Crp/Fnr family transcriptional regulator [Candidatus Saccharimonadales bacterium]
MDGSAGPSGLVDFFYHAGNFLRYRKGELVLHAEDDAAFIFYVESGFMKVYSTNDRGEECILVVYGPGELFPLLWLPRQARRNVHYQTLAPCTVLRVRTEDLETALREDAALSFEMIEHATEQHGVFIDRINNLQYKFARERLVYYLLYLARRFGKAVDGCYEIGLRISQQVLASNINLSRESVGREMDRLERKKMIRVHRGHIVLEDVPGLIRELPGASVSVDWWGLTEKAPRKIP